MSEDISFKVQLGLVLPKLKEQLSDKVLSIVDELAKTITEGTVEEGSPFPLEDIKSIVMKDFEIFIDKDILPQIKDKYSPPEEEKVEESEKTESEEGEAGE